jgi:hypothetical protein
VDKINLAQKFTLFSEQWSPRVIAEVNGQYLKLARVQGEFVWHAHEHQDELLIEPKQTSHTGDVQSERTVAVADQVWI